MSRIARFFSRSREASAQQLVATGAAGSAGFDPVDGDAGYRRLGESSRAVPRWTQERAVAYSVAAYRSNPMARAVIDTYTAFCVGDSGATLACSSDEVRPTADAFWADHRNALAALQEPWLRDHMLQGESLTEMLVGPSSGVTRFSVIDPSRICGVNLLAGNPLWPSDVLIRQAEGDDIPKSIVSVDDFTGLRGGDVMFWTSFKALLTDRRGMPFMTPILDWLDAYDGILSNLIDRTALARYMVWDVTIDGDQDAVDAFIEARGGTQAPKSGTTEVHNKSVEWNAQSAQLGSYEDTNTSKAILTLIAGGAGLSKTWLADPEDANRATSLTMAEPVRRRIAGVQKAWMANQTELVRFAVDQAVAAGRIPAEVEVKGDTEGQTRRVKAADTVTVLGPEVAAADAQITAEVLANLSKGLGLMVASKVMSPEAARVAAKKAWEDYMGVPYRPELGTPTGEPDAALVNDIATHIDSTTTGSPAALKAV